MVVPKLEKSQIQTYVRRIEPIVLGKKQEDGLKMLYEINLSHGKKYWKSRISAGFCLLLILY